MNKDSKEETKPETKSQEQNVQQQLADYKETLQRLQAEFENYKKRTEKEKLLVCEYSNRDLITKLLPVLDSFELALKNTSDLTKFKEGVELIYAELYSLLKSEGLTPVESVGKKFDPYKHEAIMKEENDKDDVVLEDFQKGYMLKDAVIRHSKVKIGTKCELNKPQEGK
ncbi:MAG: nucleotide exchange factor GrpE [Candidatus Woesearchaeota archaeon]